MAIEREDVIAYVVKLVKEGPERASGQNSYDIYTSNIHGSFYRDVLNLDYQRSNDELDPKAKGVPDLIADALWEMVRRGWLRPSPKHVEHLGNVRHIDGGFSLTATGREVVEKGLSSIPAVPHLFARLIEPYRARFGDGFYQRALECVRCIDQGLYLAACVMAGAAHEAVLLAVGIEAFGEENALKIVDGNKGRVELLNKVCAQTKRTGLQDNLRSYSATMNGWRDEPAHGKAIHVHEEDAVAAQHALVGLVRLVSAEWDELTPQPQPSP